ncbi:peptidase C39 family protein [Streptomyces sp. AV19]|uniref:peptidase C39 family protein n=1 Tax=Streptomyces sp. AV19 TaxID=2793068 RepID=UPI0018FEF4FB|nr:peptidase C39 family protein [Streptomyces sp. AV19]MBH1936918.1 peptidase C39 family protein [Streptomyces sp. AV19]MDG4532961.1 peptidase C39 family protein [Streptomyces sp. AV19]
MSSRRTVLTAALAVAAAASLSDEAVGLAAPGGRVPSGVIDYHAWAALADWKGGRHNGTRARPDRRPGLAIDRPAGTLEYADPHAGGAKSRWEYATWVSPTRTLAAPATELVVSWNARTPAGTWIQAEARAAYTDRGHSPWYVMGRWTSGDAKGDIRRTSVDGQKDGKSSVSTDTLAVEPGAGVRIASYTLRLTLFRRPGTSLTPVVWRLGAMGSDIPDRFTVPASRPGEGAGHRLTVPRYSQEIHKGQYPEYDNGGEAWCSPTSSQMVVEHWGRRPTPADLAWVNPDYADPQVCHAARMTYDYQYKGCGNWPFNAAYAATYQDLQGVVTRLRSLNDAERLIRAGIPVITSQSFLAAELDGAGYGTAGHLMCVVGFTRAGDVVANDPAAPSNDAVQRVYKRRQFENIWLRTKRHDAQGKVKSGSGGVCYLYFPLSLSAEQRKVLRQLGIQ